MLVRFDRFLVDQAGRRVLRDNADVHLTPKAFELLVLLIERRPAAVSKAQIMETLWPRIYVQEANVANLVAEIRAALGDSPSVPLFIRTVPRFGYAFSGAIDVRSAAEASSPPASPGTQASGPGLATLALVGDRGHLHLPPGPTILGREGVAADLLNSPLVSRRHVKIEVNGEHVSVEDLGSKNGCTLNGQRISGRVSVALGDRIGIGPIVVTLVLDESATRTYYGHELHGT